MLLRAQLLPVAAAIGLVAVSPGPAGPGPPHTPPSRGCVSHGQATVRHGPAGRRVVALTFDDGPWSDTPAVVATLERFRVPATFFVLGRQVAGRGDLLRRELSDGDALGNHSYSHPDLVRGGGAERQLRWTSDAIKRGAAGYRPCVFRPPYGSQNASVRRTARRLGLSTITWDVDPRDWSRPGTAAIVQRVLGNVHNGSIVLMHDGGGPREQTLAALPAIIQGLRRRHFGFVTVPALLGYRAIVPRPPQTIPPPVLG